MIRTVATSTVEPIVPIAITIPQAAEISAIGETRIKRLIREGRLVVYRPEGIRRTLVDLASLRAFMNESRSRPPRPSVAERASIRAAEENARRERATAA
jgi:hypothetical protein